jgi:predicted dehydrogenase
MRVLLVGLGRWGEKHLRVLRELGAQVWVADVTQAGRERALTQGLDPDRVVADYRKALPEVDAVDVVTPADSHSTIAIECLAAGRHCFIEKPLAAAATEGWAVAAAAAAVGRVVQVGHVFRFHPVTAALRRALSHGRIGRVRFATGRFAGFKRPRTDVGVTWTDGIHYFDLFAHLLGRRPTRVLGFQRDFLGRGLDDMAVAVVSYGDIDTVVESNYFVPGVQRECVVVGEVGSLVADYDRGTLALHRGEHRRGPQGWEAVDLGQETLEVVGAEPLRAELHAFLRACAGEIPNAVPPEYGARALEVAEAAARSAALGGAVSLEASAREMR